MKFLIFISCLTLAFIISLQAGDYGTLTGKVVDENGKPIIGATVLVLGTNHGTYVKDKNGNFIVKKINPGTYKVKIRSAGFHEEIKEVDIYSDSVTVADFILKFDENYEWNLNWYCCERLMVDKGQIGTIRIWSESEIQDYGGYFWGR